MTDPSYVVGLDYGTDSLRALVVDAADGREAGSAVAPYPRWAEGRYCDGARQRFRQHPRDHLDALRRALPAALRRAGAGSGRRVIGLGIDTTGSTPVAVDRSGRPLALREDFADDPDAMFVLWKDHTAVAEAEEINALAHADNGFPDYTRYVGGIYSSEWYFAKILHVLRASPRVRRAAWSWVEHCDWLPAELTGDADPARIPRSRCAAGHKAMWHPEWDGLPAQDFLGALDRRLDGLRERLYRETATSDHAVGGLSPAWARALGLPPGIPVAVGAFDAHLGAVGSGARPGEMAAVMGTSTCTILSAPAEAVGGRLIPGICGQVDGSVVPGYVGLEAGQGSFGDVYAWYRDQLAWPLGEALAGLPGVGARTRARIAEGLREAVLPALNRAAERLPPEADAPVALDWFNGRRSPDADERLRGAVAGLHLGSDAPRVYRALCEATAFGLRAIVERFESEGIAVGRLVALGGIARKSPYVVRLCADVLDRRLAVVASDECCALGAAIMGAVAAGRYRSVPAAQRRLASPKEKTYRPRRAWAAHHAARYERYRRLGAFAEGTAAGGARG